VSNDEWRARSAQVRERLDLPPLPMTPPPGAVWAVTMVKDEADVIERTLRHLAAQGVDGILVADNGSTDGTLEILERLATELPLYLATDREPAYYQAVKMTLLADWARQAGAEWIIPFDADELWFAPHGTLRSWLAAQRADVVTAQLFNLFPSALAGGWVMDRKPHPMPKVAFRAFKDARLSTGNHYVERPGVRTGGLRIVHIPWRSFEQFARKVRNGAAALALTDLTSDIGGHWRATGVLPDSVMRDMWDDLLRGLTERSLGWSPTGWGVAVDVTTWASWDPDGVLHAATGGAAGIETHKEDLTVLYGRPPGPGWNPVTLMARQAAFLLGGRYVEIVADTEYTRLRAATGLLPRRRGRGACLVIAPQPVHLSLLLRREYLLEGYDATLGWVIDSFLDDRIPHMARGRGHFDQLFITDGELVEDWARATRTPTSWLPWGADVLSMGPLRTVRPVDLQRIGRQPESWDDDQANAQAAAEAGIIYAGRPGFTVEPVGSQELMVDALARAKFALAFSNRHSPAAYTHPTHEYLTGRWTTALAAGASVAGIAPRCRATTELLWDGALVEFESVDRREGLETLAAEISAWTPRRALVNRAEALRRLDWRWRYRELAALLGLVAPVLEADMDLLQEKIGEVEASLGRRGTGGRGQ